MFKTQVEQWATAKTCCVSCPSFERNGPINLKVQHPPPPDIRTFKDWLVQIPSDPGKKSCSNAPPISTELPLLKDKFRLQSNTLHVFQRERCHNDTCKLLLKTLLKQLLINKGEILSFKSVNPCKNQKNSQAYYIVRTRNNQFKFPPSLGTMHSQMPRVCLGGGGGCWSFELIGA